MISRSETRAITTAITIILALVTVVFFVLACIIFLVVANDDSFSEGAKTAGPWFGVCAALLVAVLTLMYVTATQDMAHSTAALAEETKRSREELSAPAVTPYFTFERRLLMVAIENIGAGIATEVIVKFDPPIPRLRAEVRTLPVNGTAIPVLRPHERFSHFVDVAPTFFSKQSPKPMQYVATVAYKHAGRSVEIPYPLDLSVYEGMLVVDEEGMTDLVKHVKRLADRLERVTDLSALKIKTPRDIKREHAEWLELEAVTDIEGGETPPNGRESAPAKAPARRHNVSPNRKVAKKARRST